MNIPKTYEALAAELASEKILSKTLQGQKEDFMMLADQRKVDLDAALDREAALDGYLDAALRQAKANWDYAQDKQQRLTVAEKRASVLESAAREMIRIAGIANQGSNAYNRAIINLNAALKPAEGEGS